MWFTSVLLLVALQGIVNGYSRHSDNSFSDYGEEDLYRDLDYWNRKDTRLDTPVTKAISAAEHSLSAAKAVVQARKYAAQALVAAQQAAKAAALAGKHSKMAAHMASAAASRSAAHLANVPGAKSAASALSGRRPGSSAAAAGGRRPGSAAAAAGGRRPGSAAAGAGGRRPGSSAAGGRRPAAGSRGGSSSKPTISGTPTGSSKGGSSSAAGGSKTQSFNVVLRFPTYRFYPALSQGSSRAAISLKRRMCNAMKGVFKRGEMLQCYIKSLKSGSLLVDFFLRFAPSVKDAIQRIKNAIKSGYFNGLPVQKTPVKVYNVKGGKPAAAASKTGCKPCKTLAPGVQLTNQSQCPTGYCATLMINPAQVMKAAAPAMPPAYPQMNAQPSYGSCPQMCQPPATQYSCPPACPPSCCPMGKK